MKKHRKAPTSINCGKTNLTLKEFLDLTVIKEAEERTINYKESHGQLPNYTKLTGLKINKDVYKILYNL